MFYVLLTLLLETFDFGVQHEVGFFKHWIRAKLDAFVVRRTVQVSLDAIP